MVVVVAEAGVTMSRRASVRSDPTRDHSYLGTVLRSVARIGIVFLVYSRHSKFFTLLQSYSLGLHVSEVVEVGLPEFVATKVFSNNDRSDRSGDIGNPNSTSNSTKIVAVADTRYKDIAFMWYERMATLGYTTHVVATVDMEAHTFLEEKGVRVETLLPRNSSNWPIPMDRRPQQNKRKIFGTRWVYVLAQLKSGSNVLLTDADNIFVRYLPMEELEASEFDVFHAYAGNFPVRFLSMGFTVCGGMAWIRASPPAIRYVESVLEQCGWSGIMNSFAKCDDQQVVNSKFFSNTLNYTFYSKAPSTDTFWKQSLEGKSQITGHKFKIWDVDTAYRGPIDGYNRCPQHNWVAMPLNTLDDPSNKVKRGDEVGERKLRLSQWM
eukprot:CAMPEP_0113572678 /NCGR_PEP_ID=MMETSP0015_2-20120614/26217_1 /TAXON_ID=2838 /ORGANISM="Odontella" /LENGTH=378 /DNA_ID=CAMNT_0000475715 /DNA_START=88 /DNA_END=1221 /DNA_ORIENTATION=+ /assembly_acc=CAM_ASM_000160